MLFPLKDNLPAGRLPIVTLALIAANAIGHVAFDQGGLFQLLVNVVFLWWFGPSVEDSMAPWRFVLLCLLGALAAVGLRTLIDADAAISVVAATGVVATLLGSHLALYPSARVVTVVFLPVLFTLLEPPAWVLAGLWFVLQALVAVTGDDGAVAFLAPLGGFAVGLLTIRLLAQRRKQVPARRAKVALP